MSETTTPALPVTLCVDCGKAPATTTCDRPPCDGRDLCVHCYTCHDPGLAWPPAGK